ncbi:hypothetical protein BURCENBC7_AP0583 [Burkholderia cenocepacia BC7]|nr:hypothetical protein BURCENBC7_AP0583 [Burkholderia cenocepacia BC7]
MPPQRSIAAESRHPDACARRESAARMKPNAAWPPREGHDET